MPLAYTVIDTFPNLFLQLTLQLHTETAALFLNLTSANAVFIHISYFRYLPDTVCFCLLRHVAFYVPLYCAY